MAINYDWCKFQKNGAVKQDWTSEAPIPSAKYMKEVFGIEKPKEKVKATLKTKKPLKKTQLKAKTPLKKSNKPIKGKKKTRTKAVDISAKVKKIVLERDKGICVICGKAGIPNCHYKRRSQGGLGIEQNVVCACIECHNDYDNGKKVIEYKEVFKEYLKGKYENWNEKDLIYRKGV